MVKVIGSLCYAINYLRLITVFGKLISISLPHWGQRNIVPRNNLEIKSLTPVRQWDLLATHRQNLEIEPSQNYSKAVEETATTSKELQATCVSAKFEFMIRHNESWQRRQPGRVPKRKPVLTKKNTQAHLTRKKHQDDSRNIWQNILWTEFF